MELLFYLAISKVALTGLLSKPMLPSQLTKSATPNIDAVSWLTTTASIAKSLVTSLRTRSSLSN